MSRRAAAISRLSSRVEREGRRESLLSGGRREFAMNDEVVGRDVAVTRVMGRREAERKAGMDLVEA